MPTPVPAEYRRFVNKAREFFHVEGGWCVRQVTPSPKSESVWRVFYGVLQPGCECPEYVNLFREAGSPVQFGSFGEAVGWVVARRFLGPG
jgi:hypothetical protein